MRFTRSAVLAALLACAAAPRAASAGDKPAPSPPVPETADSLYNQGNDAYDRGDYALALALYSGAFKLRKSYDIARNLGLAELKLGKPRDAIEHFTYSLDQYPSNRADTKKQVVEWLAQAKALVGALRLEVEPEAAVCKLNGSSIAIPPDARSGDIFVDPGETKVECAADGYGSEKRVVTLEKGARETVTIKLVPNGKDGQPPPPRPGSGIAYSEWSLRARQRTTWVGLGLGTVLTVGGVVSAVLSGVKGSDGDGLLADLRKQTGRDSPCAAPAAARCGELLDTRKFQDVTGNVAFWTIFSGVAIAAFTASYVWPSEGLTSPSSAPPKPKVGASLTPGGVVITGSF